MVAVMELLADVPGWVFAVAVLWLLNAVGMFR